MAKNVKKDDDYAIKSVFVVMIVLVVFFGLGYFIGVSIVPKQEEVVVNEEIEYAGDEPFVVQIMNDLVAGYPCSYLEYYTNDKSITVSDIPDELLYRVVEQKLNIDNKKSISTKDFNSEIQKHFSVGYDFNPDSLNYNGNVCYQYRYDSLSSKYVRKDSTCEFSCGPNGTQYIITNAETKDLELKIYIRVLFGSEAESIGYYSDYQRTKLITDDYNHLEKYFSKGSEYLFVFQRVDDNYLFVSSDRV